MRFAKPAIQAVSHSMKRSGVERTLDLTMTHSARAATFEALFRRHADDVRRYAQRRVEPGEVEEVVAQTFESVWRNLDRIPVGAELPWLYGVARRVSANQRRGERRRRRLVEHMQALTPRSSDASDAVDHPPVLEALGRLNDGDRELLCLIAWEGLGREELAQALGISRAVLRLRLLRARRRFVAALEEVDRVDPASPYPIMTTPRSRDV